jgi:hypothetical protein
MGHIAGRECISITFREYYLTKITIIYIELLGIVPPNRTLQLLPKSLPIPHS